MKRSTLYLPVLEANGTTKTIHVPPLSVFAFQFLIDILYKYRPAIVGDAVVYPEYFQGLDGDGI